MTNTKRIVDLPLQASLDTDTDYLFEIQLAAGGSGSSKSLNKSILYGVIQAYLETQEITWDAIQTFTLPPVFTDVDGTKLALGLGQVDNINDVDKPVSTAQAAADTAVLASAESYTDTKFSSTVQSVVAGDNITVDNTDPANPIISSTGGGGGGGGDVFADDDNVFTGTNEFEKPVTLKSTTDAVIDDTELCPQGAFDDPAQWTQYASDWVVSGGYATCTLPGTVPLLVSVPTFAREAGKYYLVHWIQQASDTSPSSVVLGAFLGSDAIFSQAYSFTDTGAHEVFGYMPVFGGDDIVGDLSLFINVLGTTGTMTISGLTLKEVTPAQAQLIQKASDASIQSQVVVSPTGSVGIGLHSLDKLYPTEGNNNVAVGNYALGSLYTGDNNSAFGYRALNSLAVGSHNTAIGAGAAQDFAAGNGNTSIGDSSAVGTTGYNNTSIGCSAGMERSGSNNVVIGFASGGANNANDCIVIGTNAYVQSDGATNEIVLGTNAAGNGSNTATLGSDDITDTYLKGRVWHGTARLVEAVVAGSNITVDNTDPANPIISSTGGGGGGGTVDSVVAGTGISVDSTDPANPSVSITGGALGTAAFTDSTAYATAAQGATADSAVQPGDLATVATSGAAANVSIVDAGGYFTSTDVEGALQELGAGGGGGGSGDVVGPSSAVNNHVTLFNGTTGKLIKDGGALTTAIVPDSTNARYVTDAELAVISNTSGTNTGDSASIPVGYIDTDDTMAADSDTKVPSQKAVVTYVAAHGGGSGSGRVLQTKSTTSSAVASTTSTGIPADNTIPQNTEGDAYTNLDVTITPSASSSTLKVTIHFPMLATSATNIGIRIAAFRDSGVDAVYAADPSITSSVYSISQTLVFEVAAGSTSATTFTLRIGVSSGTGYINRTAGTAAWFNGVMKARMEVQELSA